SFFPSDRALLVPRTADGRVLFAVPWMGKVLLGTTDVPTDELAREPCPDDAEIDYILHEAGRYLNAPPARRDVRSAWAGLRPLVDRAHGTDGGMTRRISREHAVEISRTGLVTVAGGKWTTYRAMAQDTLEACARAGLLATLPACRTRDFVLTAASHRAPSPHARACRSPHGAGDHALCLAGLTPAMIRHVARYQYARKVEDVLARRSRILFLDATAAARAAPAAAALLQAETGVDAGLDEFMQLARRYGAAV